MQCMQGYLLVPWGVINMACTSGHTTSCGLCFALGLLLVGQLDALTSDSRTTVNKIKAKCDIKQLTQHITWQAPLAGSRCVRPSTNICSAVLVSG